MEDGRLIDVNAEQVKKEDIPIERREYGRLIDVNDEHSEKQQLPSD
jgi:hypothetical protein